MDHSPSPLPVKKEPSELDSLKRKSRSESNDENKKKKPAPNLDDIKPQKMNTGESSRSLCGICFNSKSDPDMFKINTCNHSFCVDCISKYMDSQITNKVVKVTCPNPNCYTKLKPEHLVNIMSREFLDRWEFAKYKSKIPLEQKTYCPFEDCSILLVKEDSGGEVVVTSCECPYCHRLFCAQCRVPWHAEKSCEEFQNLKVPKQEQEIGG
ncbi:E3 ubiquitin-protein ligase RSL1-like [Vicia villosa]|uniref:E3 ubiquitin-protein ligase RSL1-like n=1 Tax=Vicia villosa TaxID=3911 RepID=UPI00273C9830|nr:E3 ubiquitin-protein ligase RSL1-like [Vicia villosa]